jgi:hypothetical protein
LKRKGKPKGGKMSKLIPSSLEQKAKTLEELKKYREECISKLSVLEYDKKLEEKWVRLVDAEKELEEKQGLLDKEIEYAKGREEQVVACLKAMEKLHREKDELRSKIQELAELFKDKPRYEELDDIGGMESYGVQAWGSRVEDWIAKLEKKFEELKLQK